MQGKYKVYMYAAREEICGFNESQVAPSRME